jgi:hypothetical protein
MLKELLELYKIKSRGLTRMGWISIFLLPMTGRGWEETS